MEIINWSASRQSGFLSLLCLVDTLVSFSISGVSVNYLGIERF